MKSNVAILVVYLLVLVMFFISLNAINIQNGVLQTEPRMLMGFSAEAASESLASFVLHEKVTRAFSGNLLYLICCASFLLVYIGAPLYYYLTLLRPLKAVHQNLMVQSAAPGKIHFAQAVVRKISVGIHTILRDRESAAHILDGIGKSDFQIAYSAQTKNDRFARSLLELQERLKVITEEEKKNAVISSNSLALEKLLKEETDWQPLVRKLIVLLTRSVSAGVGVLYSWEEEKGENYFELLASYGYEGHRHPEGRISGANGQLGEAAREKKMILLGNVPGGYLKIQSGLGASSPKNVLICPLLFKGELYGMFELAFLHAPEQHELAWLQRAGESIGAHFFNYKVNLKAKAQLEALAKKQAEELEAVHHLQRQTFERLELKLKEVEEEKLKNDAVLEGCVDGVVIFSSSGHVTFCNRAATEILETAREKLMSREIFSLLPVRISGEKILCTAQGGEKEISVRTEVSLGLPSGNTVDVLITCTRVTVHSGALFTFFIQKISADLF